jgi:TP901 family phage tail tape measure protein
MDAGRIVATVAALVMPQLDTNFATKLGADLGKATDKATANLGQKLGKSLSNVGSKLTASVTAPILGLGAAAIAAGISLDDALDKIRVTTGATGDALAQLTEDFKAVNTTVVQDIDRTSEVFSVLASRVGLTGKPLQDLTRNLLYLEEATGTALDPAVFGQFFQVFAFTGEQATKSLDVLLRASQFSGVGVQDLATTLQTLKPVLSQTGLSFEEGASLVASLGKAGIDAEGVLQALGRTATKAAKDGKPFNQVFETTLAQIQQLVKEGKQTEALDLAGQLFGPRGGVRALEAIQSGAFDIGAAYKSVAEGTDTVENATLASRDFSQQLILFKKRADQSLGDVGLKLFPVLQQAIEQLLPPVVNLLESFANLDEGTQSLIIKVLGFSAVLGPVLGTVGKITSGISGLSKIAPVAGKAFSGLKAGFTALVAIPPVAWVAILGVAAIIAVVVLIVKNWDKIKAGFEATVEAIKVAWNATLGFIKSLIGGVVSFIKNNWQKLLVILTGPFGLAVVIIAKNWDRIKGFVTDALGFISRNWQTILAILTGPFGLAVLVITKNFDTIKAAIGAAINFVTGLVSTGVSVITSVWGVVYDVITAPFRLAQTVIGAVVEAIKGFLKGLVDAIDQVLGPLDEVIGKGAQFIGGAASGVANFVTGKASGGPVSSGRTYLVGEEGPELFKPRTGGTIVPNNALAGSLSAGASYNITVVNPTAEPTSTSIPTALRRAAQLRG